MVHSVPLQHILTRTSIDLCAHGLQTSCLNVALEALGSFVTNPSVKVQGTLDLYRPRSATYGFGGVSRVGNDITHANKRAGMVVEVRGQDVSLHIRHWPSNRDIMDRLTIIQGRSSGLKTK